MPKNQTIRRGALSRALSVSLAGARAGGVFAIDSALKRLRGDEAGDDARLDREARRFAQELGKLKGSYVKIGQLFALLGEHFLPAPLTRALHELEAQTEPLPWVDMEPHFRAALGAQFDELDIEPQALAAASLYIQVSTGTRPRSPNSLILNTFFIEALVSVMIWRDEAMSTSST